MTILPVVSSAWLFGTFFRNSGDGKKIANVDSKKKCKITFKIIG